MSSDFYFNREMFLNLDFYKPMIAIALLAFLDGFDNVLVYAAYFVIFLYLFIWGHQLNNVFVKKNITNRELVESVTIEPKEPVKKSGVDDDWMDVF